MTLKAAITAMEKGKCFAIGRKQWGISNDPNSNLLVSSGTCLQWIEGCEFLPMIYHLTGQNDWLLFDENRQEIT